MVEKQLKKAQTKKPKAIREAKPTFYIGIQQQNANVVAYSVASDPTTLFGENKPQPEPIPTTAQLISPKIRDVFLSFKSTLELYRKFIPLTLIFAPMLSNAVGINKIRDFAVSKGEERSDLSDDKKKIYELKLECYREFTVHQNEAESAAEGVAHLPEVMVIGLISCYDAFLSSLLRAVLNAHPEIVLTSDKAIKYSDLVKYPTVESARQAIIDKEIESVIRESHHEQFSWMEKRFKIDLRKNLPVWPKFIELCERRNLLTHTRGIVSEQYILAGRDVKFDVRNISVGTKLKVDSAYFSKAVNIIYEIGIKLAYVFWKKFSKNDAEQADSAINELCYDLIFGRAYELAESLLSFVTTNPSGNMAESTRLMLIINYANTIRLQGRKQQAKEILSKEDWSATALVYQISVAAVNEDIASVTKLMQKIGTGGPPNAEDYRTWPVFRGTNTNEQFMKTFKSIYGEPVISASTAEITPPLASPNLEVPPTKH